MSTISNGRKDTIVTLVEEDDMQSTGVSFSNNNTFSNTPFMNFAKSSPRPKRKRDEATNQRQANCLSESLRVVLIVGTLVWLFFGASQALSSSSNRACREKNFYERDCFVIKVSWGVLLNPAYYVFWILPNSWSLFLVQATFSLHQVMGSNYVAYQVCHLIHVIVNRLIMHFGVMRLLEDATQDLYNCGLFTFIYSACVFLTLLFLYPFYLCFYFCIPHKMKVLFNRIVDVKDLKNPHKRFQEYEAMEEDQELESIDKRKKK